MRTKGKIRVIGSNNATPHLMMNDAKDCDDLDKLICHMPSEITQSYNSWENAKHIVTMWNNFDEMVEALERIENHFEMDSPESWKDLALEMASVARQVLSNIKEQQ